ncbi:MAG: Hsp70 family protein, partial [Muribaculaceae bacterium]|nr:Hsp70 family protein [Muribaculaceae bacterium]
DSKEKERVYNLNQDDAIIFQTENHLNELGDKIPADKRSAIQSALDRLKEAHKNQDVDAIEPAIKDIEARFGEAQQDILNAQAQAQAGANAGAPGADAGSASNAGGDHVTDVDFEEVK